jgi:hypothetical protein
MRYKPVRSCFTVAAALASIAVLAIPAVSSAAIQSPTVPVVKFSGHLYGKSAYCASAPRVLPQVGKVLVTGNGAGILTVSASARLPLGTYQMWLVVRYHDPNTGVLTGCAALALGLPITSFGQYIGAGSTGAIYPGLNEFQVIVASDLFGEFAGFASEPFVATS